MFANPGYPNQPDFTTFCQGQGITVAILDPTSPYYTWAYTRGVDRTIVAPGSIAAIEYVIAVYNLGMHQLLKVAQDTPPSTYFATQRATFNLQSFVAGPVSSSGDQGTNQSLVVPDFMKGLTMDSLDLLNTPWGREYLNYSQCYGPTVVGVS